MAQEFEKLTVTISGPSLGTKTLEGLKNVLILACNEDMGQDRIGVYKAFVGTVSNQDKISTMAALLTNPDRLSEDFRKAAAMAMLMHKMDVDMFNGMEVKEDISIPLDKRGGVFNDPELENGPVGDFLRELMGKRQEED